MSEKPTIGFIGVGLMGHGMAKNILQAGYPLVIKGNRNRAPVEDLVGQGATEVGSPREMAERCDVIHLCLSNAPQVESVFHGPDGILAGARPGLIVIDCSTSDPNVTLALAAALGEAGGKMVDAPLGRTPKEAEAGTLDTMVGAEAEVFDCVQPILSCWAGNINHVGGVGDGHKMKLLMNLISMSYAALYAEVTALGAKVGIAPATVQKVIGSSRLGNGFFDTFMSYAVDRDRDAHKFTIENGSKDVRYANSMAAEAGALSLIASATHQYLTHAEAIGHAQDYVPMLADHVARLNGVDLEEEASKR
ncbi:NAD(P)-dependent oxidoreductase [Pseudoponticoccus marisrubri]|uniref:3-hydroxyisobutyrate dehydrogenase n=1 Tax=Pseudoponticoccus marisrubri TaxID=1685382 RepID=A0A0W7WNE6_9RHOB|nr:NAD(P)-dependent oxidoreductase [Pseudoponticoccus marisrubri]KUF12110.1 3-hydroxyisobutyrate dehydrogenase [Pseudoponticoccus marisrubri]